MNRRPTAYVSRIDTSRSPLWAKGRPPLMHLDFEITARCNNNCIHCYVNRPAEDAAARQAELPAAAITDHLRAAAALGCLTVRFTGGEPLLRDDFEELYVTARRLGMKVQLSTNATLMTRRIANLLAAMPPLEPIDITLYGMKKKTYEAVSRTPGSFEAAWRGIHLIIARKIPLSLSGIVFDGNPQELGEFEAWAAGIPHLSAPPSYVLVSRLRTDRDSPRRNAAIEKLRLPPEKAARFIARNRGAYIGEMAAFCSKYLAPPGKRLFACGAGNGSGAIGVDGAFRPCLLLRHPAATYDLKAGSLKAALACFFPGVRELEAARPRYLERCARCFLRGLCEQCPAMSWIEHGVLDEPVDYFCQLAHAQARLLGLIEAHERAWTVPDRQERLNRLALRAAEAQRFSVK